ncbi:hypothetical protein CTB96_13955 [Cryobacterium arcticum]|uniref:Uncharacterized protein n=1 Tax=Cryobacterium arcticum TaxID=670052 RepID=A0A317ZUG5_9MICO|nr:hypothetical protein CTB96_13955 [Cryobacterium arcticum]
MRELAREQEPVSADAASAADAAPAPLDEQHHHSRHTSPVAESPAESTAKPIVESTAEPVPVRPAEPQRAAETPRAAQPQRAAPPAPLPIPEPHPDIDLGRTLTRRELRALQAAASASVGENETNDDTAGQSVPGVVPAAPAPRASNTGEAAAAEPAPVDTGSTGLNPPLGHWSVDNDDDGHIQQIGRRDDQTFDDLVGRGVGAGGIPTTTNALILPAIPRQGTAGPITSTGEIMITGSIDLPRSLGATGQLPNLFDSSEMDRMLDQLDEGGHHNDVAPVSASRAVSTHTSTRGVMTPPRKRGASLPTVLAITAAVLAIGVLSLFVIGYAFNIY